MTSSECLPSALVHDDRYYTSQNPSPGGHDVSLASYATNLGLSRTSGNLQGFHNQPTSLYRAPSNSLDFMNGYAPTEADPGSSSGASFMQPRTNSYDSSFHQPVTPESGYSNAVDGYGYMYSQGQANPSMVTTPPALSPPAAAHGHKKQKQASRSSKRSRHHQGLSPESAYSPSNASKSKLRSASRTSKNTHHNPPSTAEERKSRETHNNVEKQYRNRLNAHFENLLSALPEDMQSGEGENAGGEALDLTDRRVSKAEVLDMARRHIKTLERECAALEDERDELRDNMERLRWLFGRCEGGAGAAAAAASGELSFPEPGNMP